MRSSTPDAAPAATTDSVSSLLRQRDDVLEKIEALHAAKLARLREAEEPLPLHPLANSTLSRHPLSQPLHHQHQHQHQHRALRLSGSGRASLDAGDGELASASSLHSPPGLSASARSASLRSYVFPLEQDPAVLLPPRAALAASGFLPDLQADSG